MSSSALRIAREQAGFVTPEAAAKTTGYSPATLRTYETERVPVRAGLRTVERLLRVYAARGSRITLTDVYVRFADVPAPAHAKKRREPPTGALVRGRARKRQGRQRNRETGPSLADQRQETTDEQYQ